MKHKTWFRLVLKAIGVYFVAQGLVSGIDAIGPFLTQLDQYSSLRTPLGQYAADIPWLRLSLQHFAAPLTAVVIGLYLLFGGKWLVDKIIPSNRAYCPHCGYSLSDGHGTHCPECGVALPKSDERPEASE